jgi:hypothetical protein
MYSIREAIMSCMGMIHDLRRLIEKMKIESKMGDQSSLREGG